MRIFKDIKNNLYRILVLTVLSILESYYIAKTVFALEHSFLLACLAVLSIVTLALFILALPKKISVFIFAALGIGLVFLLYEFIDPVTETTTEAFKAFMENSYFQTNWPILTVYVLSFFVLLINFIFTILFNMSTMAAILSIVLVCLLYFSYDYINPYFSTFYLITILLVFIRWLVPQIYEKEQSYGRYLVSYKLIIIIAVFIAPLAVFVSNKRPKPLQWIDDLDWFESDESVQYTKTVVRIDGQSKLTTLSQDFTYSDSRMLAVISPYTDRLRSKTFDIYQEDRWTKAVDDAAENMHMQNKYEEMILLLDEARIPYVLFGMEIELVAQSQMVFAPLHSEVISTLNERLKENYYSDLYVDEPMAENTIYTLNAIHIDYKSKNFIDLITNSQSNNIDNIEQYVSMPDYLQDSLKPLALDLTEGAKNNYERAKIIESYLSRQYIYNNEPPEKPNNKDFVEYFLFETHEGFCTHYATSMIMLLRSLGIPCRYVTGYLVVPPEIDVLIPDVDQEEYLFTEGVPYTFNVLKENSHAWVEVWFDDFGWLAYEPTSKYQSPLSLEYKIDYTEKNSYYQNPLAEAEQHSANMLIIILASSFLFLTLLIIAVRIYIVLKRTNQEKVVSVFKSIKRTYGNTIKINKLNETAREFYLWMDKDNNDLKAAVELYEYTVFSDKEITVSHLEKMNELHKKISKHRDKKPDGELS